MRQLVLASAIIGALAVPATANERFIEIGDDTSTTTFDLSTVNVIQPGKFSVIYMTTDNPDVIRLRLAIIDDLKSACSKPFGEYDISMKVIDIKKPDMPVEKIRVYDLSGAKVTRWSKPYLEYSFIKDGKVKQADEFFPCGTKRQKLDDYYMETRSSIMGGIREKIMFDCRRGLMGVYPRENDTSPLLLTEIRGAYVTYYKKVCPKVTGEPPYLP